MEQNIYYPLDYGWYESKEKWACFCSSNCWCFKDCSGKGGFCSLPERRELQPIHKKCTDLLLLESSVTYRGLQDISGGEHRIAPLFWHFPPEADRIQPWRLKLWELQK